MTKLSDRKFAKLSAKHAANCQNCDWQGHRDDLDPIANVWERTEEGDTVWAGDCPECGAMAFTVAEITRQNAPITAARAALATLAALKRLRRNIIFDDEEGDLTEPEFDLMLKEADDAIAQAEAAGIKTDPFTTGQALNGVAP